MIPAFLGFLDFPFHLMTPARDECSLGWAKISKSTTAQAPSPRGESLSRVFNPEISIPVVLRIGSLQFGKRSVSGAEVR